MYLPLHLNFDFLLTRNILECDSDVTGRGTIQQSLIHTLIINSPLTITQFWVPVTVFATVIAYGFRYQVSDFLDDLVCFLSEVWHA